MHSSLLTAQQQQKHRSSFPHRRHHFGTACRVRPCCGTLGKAGRGQRLILGFGERCLPKAKLAAEVFIVGFHRKWQAHVFGKEFLQTR